jgi:hypothetical protein
MKLATVTLSGLWLTCLLLPPVSGFAIGTDAEENAKSACMHTLGLTEEHLTKGTFMLRVDQCMKQRLESKDQDERRWRLQQRTEKVQERLTPNSRAYIYRPIGLPETPKQRNERRKELEQEREQYELLQRTRERPSRRTLKLLDSRSSKEKRRESARLTRERMDTALKACSHHTSHFHRSNCIRAKLRQLGTER